MKTFNSEIYPQVVVEKAKQVVDLIIDNDFFLENGIQEKEIPMGKEIALEEISKYFLKRFIDGNEILFASEDDCENVLKTIIVMVYIEILKEKGMVDTYSDENTEEVIFLTKKGKEHAQQQLKNLPDELNKP